MSKLLLPKPFRKSQPEVGQVHVNVPLTNISVAFMQDANQFVADRVFPNIPSSKASNIYWEYNRPEWNRDDFQKRAPATESAGTGFNLTQRTFATEKWSLHDDIDQDSMDNQDMPLNLEQDSVEFLSQKAMIKREVAWTTAFFATSIWGTDLTGVAAAPGAGQFLQWNDPASDPIGDIRSAATVVHLASGGFRPNTFVMNQQVWDELIDHPDITDRIKYGQRPGSITQVSTEDLAQLFKVDRVFVAGGVRNTALEGGTETNAFIAGKAALLCYTAPRPSIRLPSAGYTFSWQRPGFGPMGQGIKRFRMEELDSLRVEIDMHFVHKLVSASCGVFFATAVA